MIPLLLITGLVLLYLGAELLIQGAVAVAKRLGVGSLVIGLTIVAFGTSAPELTVSIQAALSGSGDIAVTNVVGSNIFNVAFILGLAALICPIRITTQIVKVDIPIMIGVSLLCMLVLKDRALSRLEGLLLFLGIVGYTVLAFYMAMRKPSDAQAYDVDQVLPKTPRQPPKTNTWLSIAAIAGGLILLVAGSKALIGGAVRLAHWLEISDAVIGLTIISAGTSLPELATSVIAAIRRQPDIAVGNVVGSNIFNVLSILGISSLAVPYASPGLTTVDLLVMLSVAILLLPMTWSRFTLSRLEGLVLLVCYGIYLAYLWPNG